MTVPGPLSVEFSPVPLPVPYPGYRQKGAGGTCRFAGAGSPSWALVSERRATSPRFTGGAVESAAILRKPIPGQPPVSHRSASPVRLETSKMLAAHDQRGDQMKKRQLELGPASSVLFERDDAGQKSRGGAKPLSCRRRAGLASPPGRVRWAIGQLGSDGQSHGAWDAATWKSEQGEKFAAPDRPPVDDGTTGRNKGRSSDLLPSIPSPSKSGHAPPPAPVRDNRAQASLIHWRHGRPHCFSFSSFSLSIRSHAPVDTAPIARAGAMRR